MMIMTWPRTILHVDMDAFYAAIEQMDHPELKGKPLLIGYDGPRGVVSTASYEARPYGCHSAQPMVVAKRLCPAAIVLPPRMSRYGEASAAVFRIFEDFSPVIEPLSIDEAFIDLTGGEHLFGGGIGAARQLKSRIRSEVGLTASVGVAQCKYLAKLASDLEKPDGLTVLGPEEINRVLPKLPVTRLWGVGKVSAGRMEKMGIRTIGDVRARGLEWLKVIAGNDSQRLWELCHGIDNRTVVTDREARSIGHEQTFEVDLADPQGVRDVLTDLAEQVGFRLRRHGLHSRGVSVKIRFGDFKTVTRSATLPEATDVTADLWTAARALFDQWAKQFVPVRLIGITAERLQPSADGKGEEGLFPDQERQRQRRLDDVADRIKNRFGKGAIRRGGAGS